MQLRGFPDDKQQVKIEYSEWRCCLQSDNERIGSEKTIVFSLLMKELEAVDYG